MRLSFLDYSFFLMDSQRRPLDFAIVAELEKPADIEALEAGARRAFEAYPTSACLIRGRDWVPDEEEWCIALIETSESEVRDALERYIADPIDLRRERGIRQTLFRTESRRLLVTRMHHATGDGISLTLWLRTQITGLEESAAIELKEHGSPQMKSDYAFKKPSRPFPHTKNGSPSRSRRWLDLRFDTPTARWGRLGFSHNDLLCSVFFESLKEWQVQRGSEASRRGLWIPVNIRKKFSEGFGNGSSRIRVFDVLGDDASFADKARNIRKQLRWCIKHGIWNIPSSANKLVDYPKWLSKTLLWLYAHRPGVDYGTLSFSHVEIPPGGKLLFDAFSSISSVAPLFVHQSLSVTGIGADGTTQLTFTWDSQRIPDSEVEAFAALFESIRKRAYDSIEDQVPAKLGEKSIVGAEA